MQEQVICLAGPTASGKSALALALAARLNGRIINADSCQVYAQLRILTARPSIAEEQQAPHALYGFLPLDEPCSAADWAASVAREVQEAFEGGQTPILVGGTGLYFRAALEGLAEIPSVPDDIRADVRARLADEGAEALHEHLAEADPELATKLAAGDGQRIARALEVFEATDVPMSVWQRRMVPGPLQSLAAAGRLHCFALTPPREEIYARCETRFDQMLAAGALEEVRQIKDYDPALPGMKAVGVPQLLAHLRGERTLEEAASEAKMHTRRYAKRQFTWIRNQFDHWIHLSAQDLESLSDQIFSKISN